MSSASYWEKRQVMDMYRYMEGAESTSDQIAALYRKASRYLSLQADDIFEKYRTKHNLSEAEARKLLNELGDRASLDGMLQKLQNREGNKKELLRKLEAPAYRARLERLRQLQNQIDMLMDSVYQQEKGFSTSFYTELANEAYYRQIYNIQQQADAAFSFSYVSAKQIDQVINSRWSGQNYSKRIWKNTKALAADLKEELLVNLVTGRTNREVAEIIANKFGQSASNARRLVRTESNYIATEQNFKAYEECGIEKYQYLATLDLRTSPVCRKLDGEIFPVKDRKTGTNCPPMHPWCRSTTVSVVDESLIATMQRSAIDPATGKRIKVPRSMTYRQWYDKYVRGKPEAELEEKKIQKRSADRKQHTEYRKILGDEVPEKLDDFQDMKYTDSKKWNGLKEEYRIVNQYEVVEGNVPPKKIVELHKSNMAAREEFSGRYGKDGNVATAQCNGEEFIAHSKVADAGSKYYKKYSGQREFAFLKADNERQFTTRIIGWDRKVDSEAKIFEHLNSKFGNQKMQLFMNTGFPMCDSCRDVARQYRLKNPNVEVNVVSRKGNQDDSDGRKH